MKIHIVTPAARGSLSGNRVTAERWRKILRSLGHLVTIEERYEGGACDLLVALHAKRSAASVIRSLREDPSRPCVVALTGTDLYRDLEKSRPARRALECATRIIVLHPGAMRRIPPRLRSRTRVIFQSVVLPRGARAPGHARPRAMFDVCVMGHLRAVKDPFRMALAARSLPPRSRVRVLHVGAPLERGMADRARREETANPRYRWLGPLPRARALRLLARSRLLVLTSRMEGGANVVGEAVVAGVPVLSSRIDGSIGLLGAGYPGYFRVGRTRELAALVLRAETDGRFYRDLKRRVASRGGLFDPARERGGWARLVSELRHPEGSG